jgi:hypothetical protein
MGSNISKRAGRPLALIEAMPIMAEASMRWIIRGEHASVQIGTSGSARRERRMPYATAMRRSSRKARLSSQLPCDRASFHNRTAQGAEP